MSECDLPAPVVEFDYFVTESLRGEETFKGDGLEWSHYDEFFGRLERVDGGHYCLEGFVPRLDDRAHVYECHWISDHEKTHVCLVALFIHYILEVYQEGERSWVPAVLAVFAVFAVLISVSKVSASWANKPSGVPSGVPPPSVPLSFLAAAAAGLVACGASLVWVRAIGSSDPTADQVVAATHFGVLAALSMGVLGAVHQFTPVITGRPLRSIAIARATFAAWLAGSWMLPLGIAFAQVTVTALSGVLVSAAIVLLVVNLSKPLMVSGKGAPVVALRFSLVAAVGTACLGAVFVGNRQGDWFRFSGHVDMAMGVLGLFGWLGITYVGVAEKLWSMFLLAHVPRTLVSAKLAVWMIPVGVVPLCVGMLFNIMALAWAGAVLLAVGLGAHLTSLVVHVRHRRRKADLHLVFIVTSAAWLIVGACLSLASSQVIDDHEALGVALAAGAVVSFAGWLLVALVGHAHKVIPFIVWTSLRARGIEKGPGGKPLMFAELYDHRLAAVTYALVTAGVAAECVGFAASLALPIGIGGALLVATGLLVAVNLSLRPSQMILRARRATIENSD